MSKEKVVVFYVGKDDGPEGFVIVSADSQVQATPVIGDVFGAEGRRLDDYEIVSGESQRVFQKWESARYTQLSMGTVLFDPRTGNSVRALREFPSGDLVRYIGFSPGPVYSSGLTIEEAMSKLGTNPSAGTEPAAAPVSSLQSSVAAQVNPSLPPGFSASSFLGDAVVGRRKRQGKPDGNAESIQSSPKTPSGSGRKG